MKIVSRIRKMLRVQYRLSVLYRGEVNFTDIPMRSGRLSRRMAKRMNAQYWALYKTGPFCLPERKVDGSDWEGGEQ